MPNQSRYHFTVKDSKLDTTYHAGEITLCFWAAQLLARHCHMAKAWQEPTGSYFAEIERVLWGIKLRHTIVKNIFDAKASDWNEFHI